MPVSGVTNFNLTRNQIINAALMEANIIGAEEVPSASDVAIASLMLNALMKLWEAKRIGNWARTEGTLFLVPGRAIYSIGTPNPANASSVNVVETKLAVAAADEATTITVVSISSTGSAFPATMLTGDNIGIQLSTGTIQWVTISGIAGAVITLSDDLAASASVGASVYSYTTTMSRPFNITQVRYRNSSNNDREMNRLAREEYFARPNKDTQSEPLDFYYDYQLNNGSLFVWPCPTDMQGRLKFTYVRTLDDLVNSTDNPDFPQEFLAPLIMGLACLLCPIYGKEQKLQAIGPVADQLLQIAKEWDIDEGSSYLTSGSDND